jgi:hypothetical protein
MSNKIFTIVVILGIIIAILFAYFGGYWQNKDKIQAAQLEMEKLRSQRDSLKTVVAYRDSLSGMIEDQIDMKENEADLLREEVLRLEEDRKNQQLTVRNIRKKESLQKKFQETFPEVANSDWGVTEVFNEQFGVGVEYLLVPVWFSETFIIDHKNSLSYRAQKDSLLLLDSLNQFVILLKDSVIVLERLNREAFEVGYDSAYTQYEELYEKYIDELQKGNIDWGWQAAGIVGGGVIGILIGRGTK